MHTIATQIPANLRGPEVRARPGLTAATGIGLSLRRSDGRLFELDVWKTDFSPLRRWPVEADIRDAWGSAPP